jgi:uncharacterized membrane protein required for colicin V production
VIGRATKRLGRSLALQEQERECDKEYEQEQENERTTAEICVEFCVGSVKLVADHGGGSVISPSGFNWFDVVVLLALVYGIWSGIRAGLSGELIRLFGLVLMAVLGLTYYLPVGKWLQGVTGWVEELANLVAFISIAVAVYLATLLIRLVVHKRMKKLRFTTVLENVGGAVAGVLRMAILMAWVSLMLAMMRSPFWHEQIVGGSQFGSFVVKQFPAIEAVAKKDFPETLWFMKDLKRPGEVDVDKGGAVN